MDRPEDLNTGKAQWIEDTVFLLSCHDRGIGCIYEIRRGEERHFKGNGRCKFPRRVRLETADKRNCWRLAIEIDMIEFDKDRELFALEFKFWYEARGGGYVLDHRYRYQPNAGMTNAWPQRLAAIPGVIGNN